MSAIFTHGAAQQGLAEETRDRRAQRLGAEVHTEIAAAGTYTLAEDYHQKYMLRRAGNLLTELQVMFPRTEDLVASTAVARINGYLGGCGDLQDFHAEVDSYGLSADAKRLLIKLVEQKHRPRRL